MSELPKAFTKALEETPPHRLHEIDKQCDHHIDTGVGERFDITESAVCSAVERQLERLNRDDRFPKDKSYDKGESFDGALNTTPTSRLKDIAETCSDSHDRYSSVDIAKFKMTHPKVCNEVRNELSDRGVSGGHDTGSDSAEQLKDLLLEAWKRILEKASRGH